jgi:hypothetical protein
MVHRNINGEKNGYSTEINFSLRPLLTYVGYSMSQQMSKRSKNSRQISTRMLKTSHFAEDNNDKNRTS